MGTLRKYDLSSAGCKVFFETGTGLGHSLKHALDNGQFEKIYSTEIHEPTYLRAKNFFSRHKKVQILNKDSATALDEVLKEIPLSVPILFFLDAHFPGEVEGGFEYSHNHVSNISMPLKVELELISRVRPSAKDVIIVDDLNLYEDGPFENGVINNNYANIPASVRDLKFITSLFPGNEILRNFQDEGYLIIRPRDSLFDLKKVSQLYRLKRNIKKRIELIFGN
jgi:hypothetical protein